MTMTMAMAMAITMTMANLSYLFYFRSEDGRYLVTGECGHLPSVRVWDIQVGYSEMLIITTIMGSSVTRYLLLLVV